METKTDKELEETYGEFREKLASNEVEHFIQGDPEFMESLLYLLHVIEYWWKGKNV